MPLAQLQQMQHTMPEQFSLIISNLAVQECESLKIEGIHVPVSEMRRAILDELDRMASQK
jgi:hypothetical protein